MNIRLRFRSITGRLLSAFLAVFIPLTALQYFACRENSRIWHRLQLQSEATMARSVAESVDETFERITSDLYNADKQLKQIRPGSSPQTIFADIIKRNPHCIQTGILEITTGKSISYPGNTVPKQVKDLPPPDRWVVRAISPIQRQGDRSVVTVSLPVASPRGKPAMIYAVVTTDAAIQAIKPFSKESFRITLTDQHGRVVCQVGRMPEIESLSSILSAAPQAGGELIRFDRKSGSKGYVAIAELSGWKIIVFDPDSYSVPPIYGMQWMVWSVIAAMVAFVLAMKFGNQIAVPVKKLSRAAKAVAVGDLRRRVDMNCGGELEVLAQSFNRMAESLEEHDYELRLNARVQQCLLDITRTVHGSLDIRDVTAAISDALKDQFGAIQVLIFRVNELTNRLVPMCAGAESEEIISEPLMALAENALRSPGVLSVPSAVAGCGLDTGGETIIAVPLNAGNRRAGVLAAIFPSEDENLLGLERLIVILETFATYAAVAVHNAYIHSRTEELTFTLAALRQVEEAISSSLDLGEVAQALVRSTSDVMGAKGCAILLPDRNGYLNIAAQHDLSPEFCASMHIRIGEPWSGIAFAEKRLIARTDLATESDLRHVDLMRSEGIHGFMSAPLVVGNEAIGTINVWMDRPYKAKPTEIYLLTSIANHAAVVIANAKLFGREFRIAETLQSTLMGQVPEQIGRLRFGHKYIPALDEARVGGDIYDVVLLPDGMVYIVVADVAGKGMQAAVHISAIKHMGRAFALDHPDSPSEILTKLNNALLRYSEQSTMVTMFCALIDPRTGHMVYASAGHPPAIILTSSGRQQLFLYRTGIPIGCDENAVYMEYSLDLKPDDKLLVYTDGIIESGVGDDLLSVAGLQEMVFKHAGEAPAGLVDAICEDTRLFAFGHLRDDIAVIAVSVDHVDDLEILHEEIEYSDTRCE